MSVLGEVRVFRVFASLFFDDFPNNMYKNIWIQTFQPQFLHYETRYKVRQIEIFLKFADSAHLGLRQVTDDKAEVTPLICSTWRHGHGGKVAALIRWQLSSLMTRWQSYISHSKNHSLMTWWHDGMMRWWHDLMTWWQLSLARMMNDIGSDTHGGFQFAHWCFTMK